MTTQSPRVGRAMTRSWWLALSALGVLGWPRPSSAGALTWQPLSRGLNETQVLIVIVDPGTPHRLYAASSRSVYLSRDGGAHWRACFHLPLQAAFTSLAIDPFDSQHLLAATTNGLYGSSDGARSWRRRFRGSGVGEASCRIVAFHPVRRQEVLVGTDGGLFASTDGGWHWQKSPAPLHHHSIRDVAIDAREPDRVYGLTDDGLFAGSAQGQAWERLFASSGAADLPEETEGAAEEPPAETERARQLTDLAIDPHDSRRLYLATSDGLFTSPDLGKSWQRVTQLGLGTAGIVSLMLHAHSPTVIYAATAGGVVRLHPQDQRWEALSAGLPTQTVHALAATDTKVFAATDGGLYVLDLTEERLAQGEWPSPHDLLSNFVHEPTIAQVREAAIRYAEVQPEKIQRWRRQAYLKAFLPTVSARYDRKRDTYLNAIGSTTNPAFDRIIHSTDPSNSVNLSVNWDFGDLVWNSDQTSIDARSRLMVQLRDDILSEVTSHYFERRRLQIELMTDPANDPRTHLEKELRIQELTAMVDGLTGGWFSKQLDVALPR